MTNTPAAVGWLFSFLVDLYAHDNQGIPTGLLKLENLGFLLM